MPPPHAPAPVVERIVAKRPQASGFQYQLKWVGSEELTWEAASRVKRDLPALVEAFERQPQQQQQQQPGDAAGAAAADSAAQIASLQQQLRDQQDLLAAALKAPPQHAHPHGAQQQTSRFARKEPRTQDLREYDGAPGTKLDDWLDDLGACVELFHLNDAETVEFAASRLRGPARQWWNALGAGKAGVVSAAALGAALRARFQPITSERVAREQMRALRQGSRGINEFISEFQRLHALLPDMSPKDALFAFESGVSGGIALELRKAGATNLADAIALAARIGGLTAASSTSASSSSSSSFAGRGSVNQMQMDDGAEADLEERVTRAVLNAMQAQGSGLGAKTQTQRGYAQERNERSAGGLRGGRFGSGQGRTAPGGGASRLPSIPNVPADVVERRKAANQCFRCGAADHSFRACPNAASPSN